MNKTSLDNTLMDSYYNEPSESESYYYSIYIERREDARTNLEKNNGMNKLLDDVFDERIYISPTFAMWNFEWDKDDFGQILTLKILLQFLRPLTIKKIEKSIYPRTDRDIVWNIEQLEDSYVFIENLLKLKKFSTLDDSYAQIWNITKNGTVTLNYDEVNPFSHSKAYIGNMAYQEDYMELMMNEEWGQLLLW